MTKLHKKSLSKLSEKVLTSLVFVCFVFCAIRVFNTLDIQNNERSSCRTAHTQAHVSDIFLTAVFKWLYWPS
ncbi:hypothetical protein EFP23_11285 [Lacticaseibacillus paracasei]|nr:hypothetical protein [Lacticaseibacillus paracasei]